jgi:predicted O-linked N-acetylglucosamine transferase (SPINDLY family)
MIPLYLKIILANIFRKKPLEFISLQDFEINENDLKSVYLDPHSYLKNLTKLKPFLKKRVSATHKSISHVMSVRGRPDLYVEYLKKSLKWRGNAKTEDVLYHAMLFTQKTQKEDFKKLYRKNQSRKKTLKIKNKNKTKIAYTCCYFYGLGTRICFLPLMKHHDRNKYEIFAFSDNPATDENSVADHWIVTKDLSDKEFFHLVRQHEIDILVELNGRGGHNRFNAFEMRAAPIQLTFGNFPAPTGITNVDATLADGHAFRHDSKSSFLEQVYLFNRVGVDFSECWPKDFFPCPALPPSLHNGYITFGCFGGTLKINEPLIQKWISLVHRVPRSRLFLKAMNMSDPDTMRSIRDLFEKNGMDLQRLMLEGGSDHQEMLKQYGDVDVALDTFPYSGGNTSLEALWQGVPVVTLEGDRWASCITSGFHRYLGLESLVANSWEDYVAIAEEWAGDVEKRAKFRSEIRHRMKQSGFLDIQGFAREIERLYEQMIVDFRVR